MSGVCSIQVRLNSPTDSVKTIRLPATMAGNTAGTRMPMKRWRKVAPSVRAASSSATRSWRWKADATVRTMNGSVKTMCPTRMNAKLWRKALIWPYARISASAVASPGTATGSVSSSSKMRAARDLLRAMA